MKKCIYLLVDSRHYAGIESHILHLSTLIQRKHCHATVVFLQDYGYHPLQKKLDNRHIPWLKLDGKLTSILRFINNTDKRAVIHAHGYKASIFSRLACTLCNRYCVTTFHCGDTGRGIMALYTWLDKSTAILSTNICVSTKISAWLGGYSFVLDNFITATALPPRPRNSTINVAFVGRLSYEKGPDIFCQMAQNFVATQQRGLTFSVYGSGPMAPQLKQQNGAVLQFKGFCAEMDNHWHNIDILVVSSRQEGMPMVVVEAMMHGVCVVASPCGALPQLLADKRGWLASHASEQALLEALQQCVATPQKQRQQAITSAYDYAIKHCSGEAQWPIYQQIYA